MKVKHNSDKDAGDGRVKGYLRGNAFVEENLGSAARINLDGRSEGWAYLTQTEVYAGKKKEEEQVSK